MAMISRHTNYNYNRRRICHHKCSYCAAHHMCRGIENQRRLLYALCVHIFHYKNIRPTKCYQKPQTRKESKYFNVMRQFILRPPLEKGFCLYNKFKNWTMFEIFIHMNINRDHQNEIEINVRSIVYKKKTLCIKTHAIFSFYFS